MRDGGRIEKNKITRGPKKNQPRGDGRPVTVGARVTRVWNNYSIPKV
jgi:hypothetical protein